LFADPLHQSEYEKCSDFLYPLNSGKQPDYKSNFMSVEELVLIGGPDDGVITPWQSSHFGFYDDKLDVQPYQSQGFYISDAFGLKTLDEEGRIHVYNISGVEHTHWHTNKTVFDLYIEPWLK
jgi:palmitoyl-protein thioesterase